ncbi:3-hydroxyisobutyryl-CoA hydrolase-like protein 2, mitochondrial [Tanacetum coccineum]
MILASDGLWKLAQYAGWITCQNNTQVIVELEDGLLANIHVCEFLALTGEKLNGADLVACDLVAHYSLNASVISDSLAQYGDLITIDRHSVLIKIDRIDKYFWHDTVEEIFEAVTEGESRDDLCSTALKRLKEASPLSLNITLKSSSTRINMSSAPATTHCLRAMNFPDLTAYKLSNYPISVPSSHPGVYEESFSRHAAWIGGKLIQLMHTTMVPEQVKRMKIQAGVQVSRPGELRRHIQL